MIDKKNCGRNWQEKLFFFGLLSVTGLFLLFAGSQRIFEYSDSFQYIECTSGQGVMPLYPLFLHFHRLVFGESMFLQIAVITQTVITLLCMGIFVWWLRRRFQAGHWVSGLSFFCLLASITVDFPEALINRSILTEALAYPLFYIYVILFMEAAIGRSYSWCGINGLMALVMSLIRTQMQVCFIFSAALFFYVACCQISSFRWKKKVLSGFGVILASVCIVLVGEVVMLEINNGLQVRMQEIREGLARQEITGDAVPEENLKTETIVEESIIEETTAEATARGQNRQENVMGQFGSLLIDRTYYEIDQNDEELFGNPELKELFRHIFVAAEQEKNRYTYARDGLWKWQDIMNGTAGGTYIFSYGWESYVEENPQTTLVSGQAGQEIAIGLLKAHWPRMLYHTLCVLPHGLLCTVFFQIEQIYGLCYLYTAIVYLGAILLMILGFRGGKELRMYSEFMLGALFLNIGMVVIVSIMFMSMQRYLIYGFGIFYAAGLVLAEKLWKTWREQRKSV